MSKAKIIDKKSIESILGEKKILSELSHPFIVNMIYSFQDFDYLYLVMELLSGGNLRYNLSLKKRFNEKQIKFLIGCIMVGLKYIHGQNILHRDIKPENLVFEQNGYLRITDFGIAKHYVVNNKKDTSGTIGYLAPEVLCNVNHNFSIDYYAVGIITYELMYGHRPYLGKNKHEVKQLILTRQAKIENEDLPYGFSLDIANFINGLIQRKPKNRLGKNDINEVLNHPWFDEFDWDSCLKKKLKAPYIPKYGDNFDKNYCLQSNKIGTETMERYDKIMSKENIHLIFKEFNCNKIPQELKIFNSKKTSDKLYSNNMNFNNISSNMSTTSISRNNKNENKQNNLRMYKNNNINNRNILKNNILNKDIENALYENNNFNNNNNINKSIAILNQNKYINYLKQKIIEANNINLSNYNVPNKTYRNDYINKKNNSKINYIGDMINLNISGINQNQNQNKNLIYNKNKKEKMNRNISAKYINRNKSKMFFNNSTIDSNSNNMNMRRQQQINSYKNKKNKLMNHSMKVTTKKSMNNYYNIKCNEKNKTNNIIIPKTKRDYIGKELLQNNPSTYYHSTIYSKKKTSGNSTKRLTSSNSMKNLYGNNNYLFKEQPNNSNNISMSNINKAKNNIYNSVNSSRSSKNILNVDNNKYQFLNYSMNKKNEMDNNNDIYYEIKYKNNNKYSSMNSKTRDELNYDYLYDRYKNKRSGSNI